MKGVMNHPDGCTGRGRLESDGRRNIKRPRPAFPLRRSVGAMLTPPSPQADQPPPPRRHRAAYWPLAAFMTPLRRPSRREMKSVQRRRPLRRQRASGRAATASFLPPSPLSTLDLRVTELKSLNRRVINCDFRAAEDAARNDDSLTALRPSLLPTAPVRRFIFSNE